MSPHTGQSSQLFIEANDGDAQFLPKLVGVLVDYKTTELPKGS